MQLPTTQVLEIYQQNKKDLLIRGIPQRKPAAIILGGQPACGKSGIVNSIQRNDPSFLAINGDDYRRFHPDYKNLIKNHPIEFPTDTQNFSNIFTENLIKDAAGKRFNMAIEGTMRNPAVPVQTSAALRKQGYEVGVAVIAAYPKITELGTYRRYADNVRKFGFGRLATIASHNAACEGLLTSVDSLYANKAVDFITIYSYLAKQKLAEYHLTKGVWDNTILPSSVITEERVRQMKDITLLQCHIDLGMATIKQLGDLPAAHEVQKVVDEIVWYIPQRAVPSAALKAVQEYTERNLQQITVPQIQRKKGLQQ